MKSFNYNNINRENNLIRKAVKVIKENPKKVRNFIIAVVVLIIISIGVQMIIEESRKQKYVEYDGENLNEAKYPGYKELIDKLLEEHPNWTFTLFYTKLDWNEVIKNEGHSDTRTYPLNLVPDSSSYPDDWKCEIDINKRFDNGTWMCASDKAIKYGSKLEFLPASIQAFEILSPSKNEPSVISFNPSAVCAPST